MKFRVDMFNGWDLNLDGYVILLCAYEHLPLLSRVSLLTHHIG